MALCGPHSAYRDLSRRPRHRLQDFIRNVLISCATCTTFSKGRYTDFIKNALNWNDLHLKMTDLYPKEQISMADSYDTQNHLLTYLLTHSKEQRLFEKLTGFQPVKKFPAFYETRRFITAFRNPRHLSLSWASSIQSIPPNPTSLRSIFILSSHLSLGLPSGHFPSGFPTKNLHTPLLSTIRATCPAHLILLDFITRTILGEEYRSFSSSLCSFLPSPVTPSLLDPNVLLSTLFSNTLSLITHKLVHKVSL